MQKYYYYKKMGGGQEGWVGQIEGKRRRKYSFCKLYHFREGGRSFLLL
jgi:hypothetical protein